MEHLRNAKQFLAEISSVAARRGVYANRSQLLYLYEQVRFFDDPLTLLSESDPGEAAARAEPLQSLAEAFEITTHVFMEFTQPGAPRSAARQHKYTEPAFAVLCQRLDHCAEQLNLGVPTRGAEGLARMHELSLEDLKALKGELGRSGKLTTDSRARIAEEERALRLRCGLDPDGLQAAPNVDDVFDEAPPARAEPPGRADGNAPGGGGEAKAAPAPPPPPEGGNDEAYYVQALSDYIRSCTEDVLLSVANNAARAAVHRGITTPKKLHRRLKKEPDVLSTVLNLCPEDVEDLEAALIRDFEGGGAGAGAATTGAGGESKAASSGAGASWTAKPQRPERESVEKGGVRERLNVDDAMRTARMPRDAAEGKYNHLFGSVPQDLNHTLLESCLKGDMRRVPLLIALGADIHCTDQLGNTPLHSASLRGQAKTALLLINLGANPAAQNHYGSAPLYLASYQGRLEVVRLLLEHGAPVNSSNREGVTALQVSAHRGHEHVMLELLANGADLNARTKHKNFTALRLAVKAGKRHIADILRARGAAL